MGSIDGISGNDDLWQSIIDSMRTKGDAERSTARPSTTSVPPEGIKVTLSGLGLNHEASADKTKNSDIEDSGLPENIQTILKLIREIKEQIARRQAELQALMSGKNQSAEQTATKAGNLQATIAGLNSGLMTAYARLNKAIKGADLSDEQLMKAAGLVAKL